MTKHPAISLNGMTILVDGRGSMALFLLLAAATLLAGLAGLWMDAQAEKLLYDVDASRYTFVPKVEDPTTLPARQQLEVAGWRGLHSALLLVLTSLHSVALLLTR